MNNLMFFEDKEVEIFEYNGNILFNPYHVGRCLDISNIRDSIKDFNEKQIIKLTNSKVVNADFRNFKVSNTDFRKFHNTGENFLTESGVYKLIFKSRKPIAEKFQDWVVDEVLPSIRKQGSYINSEHDNLSPEVKALISHDIEIKRLDKKIEDTRKEIEDNLPLFQVDCVLLSNCVKRKGVQILGGKETEAYKDKSIRGKVYSDIYMQIKREFGLVHNNRFLPYNALLRKYRDDAMELVENYETPLAISEKILELNGVSV